MNKNAIVILANNLDFLQVQFDNLPTLSNCDYIICTEDRIGDADKVDKLRAIVGNDTQILLATDIVNEFAKIQDTPFLHSYTMGMNILLQWYMFTHTDYDKILFTEEDVILTEGVSDIFNEDHCLFYTWSMSSQTRDYAKLNASVKAYVDEFSRMYDLHIDESNYLDLWKNTHISSGQRLYVRDTFDMAYYVDSLCKFFNSQIFENCWLNRKTHRTGYLDERFEGFYAYKTGILNNDIKPYTLLEIAKPEKVDIEKYTKLKRCKGIWHNATVNQKANWYKALKKHHKIK